MYNPHGNQKENSYRIYRKEMKRIQNMSLQKNQLNTKEDSNEGNEGQKKAVRQSSKSKSIPISDYFKCK